MRKSLLEVVFVVVVVVETRVVRGVDGAAVAPSLRGRRSS